MAQSVGSRLSEDQLAQLSECFKRIDTNRDGLLDVEELEGFFKQSFPGIADELLVQLRQTVLEVGDRNSDGKIDLNEFFDLITHHQYQQLVDADGDGAQIESITQSLPGDEIDILRDCFIKLDANGDGFVDRQELMNGVRAVLQERFDTRWEYLSKIFDVADRDKDDKLSLTDFLSSFADGPGVVPHDVVVESVRAVRIHLRDEDIEMLRESFIEFDTNEDGFIDKDELVAAMRRVLSTKYPEASDQEFEDIAVMAITVADADRDGKLNLSEFIRSFQEDQQVLPAAFIDGRAQSVKRRLTEQEVRAVGKAFAELDAAGPATWPDYVSLNAALEAALQKQLPEAQPDAVKEVAELIVVTAERTSEHGALSLANFATQFLQDEPTAASPVTATNDTRRARAVERLNEVVAGSGADSDRERVAFLFREIDARRSGYVPDHELTANLYKVFTECFPEWTDERRYAAVDAIKAGAVVDEGSRDLSVDAFVAAYARIHAVLPGDMVGRLHQDLQADATEEELASLGDHIASTAKGAVMARGTMRSLLENGTTQLEAPRAKAVAGRIMQALEGVGGEQVVVSNICAVLAPAEAAASAPPERTGSADADVAATGTAVGGDEPAAVDPEVSAKALVPAAATPRTTTATQSEARPDSAARPSSSAARVIVPATSMIVNDISASAVTEEQLRALFEQFDANGNGYLERREFKRAYVSLESYGCPMSDTTFDRLASRYCRDDKVTFDEFCLFMLHRSRM